MLDVCFGRVNTLPEALAHSNFEAQKMIRRDEQGRRHIAPPIHFRNEPAEPDLHEPRLGEHTEAIFQNFRRMT
jgi:crotonobetainyl-CoA:carnitine CoA-transferase CaiB-like acyl-CoA transferase